eukprot:RCo041074
MATSMDSMLHPLMNGAFPPASVPDPRNVTIASRGPGELVLQEQGRSRFTDGEVKLLLEWFVDAKYRLSKCHLKQSTRYSFLNVILGIPAIIIFAVAASMAMGTERIGDGEVFRFFLCILSVLGTIFSFVYASTGLVSRAQQHANAWAAYRVFANDAEA